MKNIIRWQKAVGVIDSYLIYRSENTIDPNNLPSPLAVVGSEVSEYQDADVIADQIYFYRIEAVKGVFRKLSAELTVQTTAPNPEMTLSSLPIAFWLLNETSGAFIDSSGNGRHLIPSSSVVRGVDPIDPVGELCAKVANTSSTERWIGEYKGTVTLGTNVTFMCWVKIPNNNVSVGGEFFKFAVGGKGFSVGFNNGANGALHGRYLLVGQNSVSFRPTTYLFSNDEQVAHIAVKWSGGYMSAYVNGLRVHHQNTGDYRTPVTDTFSVGMGEFSPSYELEMSRVAFYATALSDADILKVASTGKVQR